MYKYENGIVTNIPMDKIETMAKLFSVTPAYLMGWTEKTIDTVNLQLFGKKEAPTELTDGEMMLLELFRQVPAEQQNLVLDMIRVALGKKE